MAVFVVQCIIQHLVNQHKVCDYIDVIDVKQSLNI